jgi:hypothetical protein
MRIALALTGLLCSAVGAYAFPADNVPYCSSGFDKPAMLVFKSGHATLTIGKKTMKFSAQEPLEGVDGIALQVTVAKRPITLLQKPMPSRLAKMKCSYSKTGYSGPARMINWANSEGLQRGFSHPKTYVSA